MQVAIQTRVEAEVAEVLAEIANREKRSLAGQLAFIIEKYLQEEKSKSSEAGE